MARSPPDYLGATEAIAEARALSLTKVASQATPYFWIWTTRGTKTIVEKYIGTSMIWFEGVDDTDALRKINAHEGLLAAANRNVHG